MMDDVFIDTVANRDHEKLFRIQGIIPVTRVIGSPPCKKL